MLAPAPKRLVVGLLLVLFCTGTSSAAILTFTQDQLLNFDVVDNGSGPSVIDFDRGIDWSFAGPPYSGSSSTGVFFKGTTDYPNSFQYGNYLVGAIGADADTLGITNESGFDKFAIGVRNWNNYSWHFANFAVLSDDLIYSDVTLTNPGAPGFGGVGGPRFGLEFAFDPNYVIQSGDFFGVAFALAGGGGDTAHFELNPVPEPATIILLGSGLIGLAGWGRKKFRA